MIVCDDDGYRESMNCCSENFAWMYEGCVKSSGGNRINDGNGIPGVEAEYNHDLLSQIVEEKPESLREVIWSFDRLSQIVFGRIPDFADSPDDFIELFLAGWQSHDGSFLCTPSYTRIWTMFANATNMSYCPEDHREAVTETKPELQTRLDKLRREYRGVRSMIEMMQKGTEASALRKMREEQLHPIEREIERLEEELKRGPTK